MSTVDRRYFDNLMRDRKLSLRKLAELMGMNHSQLSLMFSGNRKAQIEEVAQLSQIFSEPLPRVVEALGVSVRPVAGVRVPVVGALTGDGTISVTPKGVAERATAPEGLPEGAAAIQCRTAGTPLEWMDGWVHFYRPTDRIEPDAMGRYCVVQIRGGPMVLGTLKRGYAENSYHIAGPRPLENAAVAWAAPILLTRN